jgi:hypothetical protein
VIVEEEEDDELNIGDVQIVTTVRFSTVVSSIIMLRYEKYSNGFTYIYITTKSQ